MVVQSLLWSPLILLEISFLCQELEISNALETDNALKIDDAPEIDDVLEIQYMML